MKRSFIARNERARPQYTIYYAAFYPGTGNAKTEIFFNPDFWIGVCSCCLIIALSGSGFSLENF
jgi:hypothetical protein